MKRKYQPSNGTEGIGFCAAWCDKCEQERKYRETDDGEYSCEILRRTLIYSIDDPEYPEEWIWDEDGVNKCTAFIPEGEEAPYRCDKTLDLFGGRK